MRYNCAEAAIVPLTGPGMVFILFIKDDGLKTASMFKEVTFEQPLGHKQYSALMQEMSASCEEPSVPAYLKFLRQNKSRDFKDAVTLAPWQRHMFEYKGLKLGKFLSSFYPCDANSLSMFEQEAEIKLPEDYKDFLLKTNGGQLKNHVFFTAEGLKKKRRLDGFKRFGNPDGKRTYDPPASYFRYDIPGLFLGIANDANENTLYLGLHPEIYGHVFLVTDETHFVKESSLETLLKLRSVRRVAQSFTEFLETLEVTHVIIGNE